MSDSATPEEFADINETVGAEWEAETTPHKRVREIIGRAYTPVSATAVAETAHTSAKAARKQLNAFAEASFFRTEAGESGGTMYRRSPESLVVEQAAEILANVSTDELLSGI